MTDHMAVFAVVMKYPNGNRGYHSAWMRREDAERIANVHNGNWHWRYEVEEKIPVREAHTFWERQRTVWFEDSIGGILLQEPLRGA